MKEHGQTSDDIAPHCLHHCGSLTFSMSRRATSGVVDRDKGISMVEPCRKTEEKSNDDFHGGGNNVLVDGFDEVSLDFGWCLCCGNV